MKQDSQMHGQGHMGIQHTRHQFLTHIPGLRALHGAPAQARNPIPRPALATHTGRPRHTCTENQVLPTGIVYRRHPTLVCSIGRRQTPTYTGLGVSTIIIINFPILMLIAKQITASPPTRTSTDSPLAAPTAQLHNTYMVVLFQTPVRPGHRIFTCMGQRVCMPTGHPTRICVETQITICPQGCALPDRLIVTFTALHVRTRTRPLPSLTRMGPLTLMPKDPPLTPRAGQPTYTAAAQAVPIRRLLITPSLLDRLTMAQAGVVTHSST